MTGPGTSRELTDEGRLASYHSLLSKSSNGVLPLGWLKETAEEFSVSSRTVRRIWKISKDTETPLEIVSALKKKRREGLDVAV